MHNLPQLVRRMERAVVSLVSDVRVKRESLTVIRPEVLTQRRKLFLSNTDQKLMHFLHKTVHFFAVDVGLSSDAIIYVYTQALSRLMVSYDFMCGRLVFNSEQGRFEVDCNSAGVPLSICTSDLSLQQLGDLSYPNPAFTQLILLPGDASQTPEDEPFISFQITQFKSGGFAFGTAVNHGLMDGFSLQEFARNLTSIVKKGDVAFEPIADRSCLKARSPLQIKYKHEEYMKPSELIATKAMNSPSFDVRDNTNAMHKPSEGHVFGLFSLSGKMIEVLKMKACKDGGVKHCTGFIAAMAHLWRARTAAMANMAADDVSSVQLAVDIRSRLVPPLPREFAGNAIATAYAKATARELHEQPFGEIVRKLQEGVDRITDDYVRSGIDWLELHDGTICLENGFIVTLWTHLGFGEVDLGGGIKSVYGGPVVSGDLGVVIMLAHPTDKEGIQIFMGLEKSHMTTFRKFIKNVDAVTIHSNM